jgi:hypothetical protein
MMDFLETLLEQLSVSAERSTRVLVIGTNLTRLNGRFKRKFHVPYINDEEFSSYLTCERFLVSDL